MVLSFIPLLKKAIHPNPLSLYPTLRKISGSKYAQKTLAAGIVGMKGWMILIDENQEGEDSEERCDIF